MSPRSFLALICYAALWAALPNIAHAMPGAADAGDAAHRQRRPHLGGAPRGVVPSQEHTQAHAQLRRAARMRDLQ